MTAQIADSIDIDGERLALFAEPLESYFDSHPPRPAFLPTNTANWRGYVASWRIHDNKLYIVAIKGRICEPSPASSRDTQCTAQPATLQSLFQTQESEVFAHWFSGTLQVPKGAMIGYVHMGYERRHEFDLLITIERGVVRATTTRDNRR
ncbi:MAG: hypothetical protein HZC25_11355 [Rhodospirillales bacterium]|nr:hypothetical protein [Rhodospirillales bacterium]